MERAPADVVLKYCALLDRFVRIRVFSPADIATLLQVDDLRDGRAYRQLIVNACIVGYGDELVPQLHAESDLGRLEQAMAELYEACVEVNPDLEISRVTLPVEGGAKERLHLFARAADGADDPRRALRVRDLEASLAGDVIGQVEAIRKVVRALERAAAGLAEESRPIGSFFFVGQTGVGKTELAKSLARRLYDDDPSRLVRIDCSEYAQGHEYAKLIGAPPGYVGHGEGGVLTEQLRRGDGAVVLFDEVEKADRKLHNLLLQLLDDGMITDGRGQRVDGRNVVLVLTSNVGAGDVEALDHRIGFGGDGAPDAGLREVFLGALRRAFPPEFINRLDEVVCFKRLDVGDCEQIVGQLLGRIQGRLADRGIDVRFTRPAQRHLAERGYDRTYGARHLKRVVRRQVETPLAEQIVRGDVGEGDAVQVGVRREALYFRRL